MQGVLSLTDLQAAIDAPMPKQMDMTAAGSEGPGRKRGDGEQQGDDWLDAYCWRCGSSEPSPHADGRVLCTPCRREELEAPRPPVSVPPTVYWESNPLQRCWRCMTAEVDPGDDFGLCQDCREEAGSPALG